MVLPRTLTAWSSCILHNPDVPLVPGYPWGQQPAAYVAAFRMAAAIIHNNTCASKMLWAPNNGYGYPWPFYPCGPLVAPQRACPPGTRAWHWQHAAPAAAAACPSPWLAHKANSAVCSLACSTADI